MLDAAVLIDMQGLTSILAIVQVSASVLMLRQNRYFPSAGSR
jgi:hypothetical protein